MPACVHAWFCGVWWFVVFSFSLHLIVALFPFVHAHPPVQAELPQAAAVGAEQSNAVSACRGPLSYLPMECGGDEGKQEGDETGVHSQSWSLEMSLFAISVSNSPASLQVCSLCIFMVEEGISILSPPTREFVE